MKKSLVIAAAVVSLERMIREIRLANTIASASVFNAHPGHLILTTIDQNGDPATIEFYLSNDTLMIKEGVAMAASSTPASIRADNLVFRQINTSHSKAVRVELTLTDYRSHTPRSEKFYALAVLRGSY